VVYLEGAPFKIGAASLIGAVIGLIGGIFGRLNSALVRPEAS
jgi:hypothetical protein